MGRQLLSWPSASIQCFGSFPAGLYLPTADMDLVYASEQFQRHGTPAIFPQKNQLWKVARKLEQKGVAMNIAVIAHAKVPIIKFKDRVTGLPVDISFENLGGVDAQANFRDWIHDYPDMVHLVALVKQFLVMRELNEVNTGGLGGFSIICLVVSFLQNSPKEENLAKAFINFLDFYGNKFDISRQRIIMRPPGAVQKVIQAVSFIRDYVLTALRVKWASTVGRRSPPVSPSKIQIGRITIYQVAPTRL